MSASFERKVQTNLKLEEARAAALDVAAAIERKDKALIVEEAVALREELMGAEYRAILEAARTLRFSSDPVARLEAIKALRNEVPGSTPDGSVSVSAALARLHARREAP